jgi:hypothetical protein
MVLTGEKQKYSDKNLSQCHLVHDKSQLSNLKLNPGLRGETPASNRQSHGAAYRECVKLELHIKIQSVPRSKHTPSRL